MITILKKCTRCGVKKPRSEFSYRDYDRKGNRRLQYYCKICQSDNSRSYRNRNKEQISAKGKKYYEAKKEEIKETQAEYRKNHRFLKKLYNKNYYEENWVKFYEDVINRRAAKLKQTPKWANRGKIEEFYFASDLLMQCTGEWYQVDHIVPLRGPKIKSGPWQGTRVVAGLHVETNLQILLRGSNLKKSNKHWPDMSDLKELGA